LEKDWTQGSGIVNSHPPQCHQMDADGADMSGGEKIG
jgi:hypothetical protein